MIAFQNIRNLRASEAKDIFIGMVQESEIFEYLETGQHHITLPWSKYFKITEKVAVKNLKKKSFNILKEVDTISPLLLTSKYFKSLKIV